MSSLSVVKKLCLISAGLVGLLLIFGAAAALAADNSDPTNFDYAYDNYSEGFDSFYPHNCWRSLDTVYYRGDVWEAFCKGGHSGYPNEEQAVYLARNAAGDAPVAKPTHSRVILPGETWSNTDGRIDWVRLAVFQDKLFLIYAKSVPEGYSATTPEGASWFTGSEIWVKQIDPIDPQYVDGNAWDPPGVRVARTPDDESNGTPVMSLVVKVMDNKLYILYQQLHSSTLHVLASSDGIDFSQTATCDLTGREALLNGDVVSGKGGAPLLALVTKDDRDDPGLVRYEGWNDWHDSAAVPTTGSCGLWTFDPSTNLVNRVATVPGSFRDLTVAAGDVEGCKPYGTTNLQLWGVNWDDRHIYHMQFAFDADGTGGMFDPAGKETGAGEYASSYVSTDTRGYLASCIVPQPVSGSDSLQLYARVWYWYAQDPGSAHGTALQYKMDLLKSTGSTVTDTSNEMYSPAWVLEGVIYGLPPYFANGLDISKQANFYKIVFALAATAQDTNDVTSEKTLSVSYKKQGIFGVPSASMGLSYTNALQQTNQSTTQTKIQASLAWSPDNMGPQTGIDVGAQAWGIFFVPKITNDEYELTAPDGTDLGVALYYTYISGGTDLIDTVFDKTATAEKPNEHMDPAAQAYWQGIAPYPNSLTYWDPGWSSELAPPDGTYVYTPETDDYRVLRDVWFYKELGGAVETYALSQTETTSVSQVSTNAIGISGGAFGFATDMKGTLKIGSSTSTTFGQELGVTYGVPGWGTASPGPDYLTQMSLDMYLLQAKADTAFWVPAGAHGQLPWCLTWHVRHWKSYAATDEHAAEGPSSTTLLREARAEIDGSVALPHGLRSALAAKLEAAGAAVRRGNAPAVRNLLGAVCKQVGAQSGKAIPTFEAERWLDLLRAIDADALVAGK